MNSLLNIIALVTPYTVHISFGGMVFIVIGSLWLRKKIHANDIASFATTTGIGFTFFGIVLALGGIGNLGEEADIQQKITNLLGGVFVAFIPSIVGAIVAVTTHAPSDFWRKPIEENDEQEFDIDAQILQELKKLNANIVGNNETSLTTRLEKFQLKVTENQDVLRKEFHDFAENVAKNIIEALQKSMDSLNEKLGQQFGENFKKFADAVPKLLDWQKQYRETIQETQQQLKTQSDYLKRFLKSLDSANESFVGIAEHVGKISDCSNNIDRTTQIITDSLTQAAEGMAKIRTDAERFQVASQSLTSAIEKQTELAGEQAQAINKSAISLTNIVDKVVILDDTAQKIDEHIKAMDSALGGLSRLSDTLQGKAESIEKNMTDITEGVITELAKNLRGISEVLVEDYKAVQIAMQNIIRQADEDP